ncbi:transposase [Enterococcus sp. AZ126]
MKLFVGLDVSSEKLDACFMTDDDTMSVLNESTIENSQLGANRIKEIILELSQ